VPEIVAAAADFSAGMTRIRRSRRRVFDGADGSPRRVSAIATILDTIGFHRR
jgi:hypothetical protein